MTLRRALACAAVLAAGALTGCGGDDAYVRLQGQGWTDSSQQDSPLPNGVSDSLQYLGQVTGAVRDDGPSPVRGTPARKFSTTVDLAKLRGQVEKGGQEQFEQAREILGKSLPLQAWVDDQSRIIRFKYDIELDQGPAKGTVIDVDSYLTDFGDPEPPKPPGGLPK